MVRDASKLRSGIIAYRITNSRMTQQEFCTLVLRGNYWRKKMCQTRRDLQNGMILTAEEQKRNTERLSLSSRP